MRCSASVVVVAVILGGCTTTSFAPPAVDVYHAMDSTSLDATCRLTGSTGTTATPLPQVTDDVSGARVLIKNYRASYECAMRAAADGRQWFEIPAFLALIGATGAVALGAGPKVAFVGQSANSVFTAGKNYYAPQEQVSIIRSAFEAIVCIQSEASLIKATEATEAANQQKALAPGIAASGPTITVEQQYFDLIESRLSSINGVAAQRLAQRGTFDAAGVVAEIQKAAEDLKKAEDAQKNPPQQPPAVMALLGPTRAASLELSQTVQLEIGVLQPKLDQCVARAKS